MMYDTELREGVKEAYSAAAERPEDKNVFPVGRSFAESLGYPKELLDSLPSFACEAFTGVSNVSIFSDIPPERTVLDLGCGAGLDLLIAAKRTGPNGKVIGVDFSESMLNRARQAVNEAGLKNVELHLADAEEIPLENESVDIALVNGIFNLSPERVCIFHELARVVKKGGVVYSAEIILHGERPSKEVCNLTDWFA